MNGNKRFTYVIDNGEDTIYDLSENGDILENMLEIENMMNQLDNETQELKEALLFYLDVATGLSSSNFNYDMEKWCTILLGCNYEEAKKKYGNFKYAQRWELE